MFAVRKLMGSNAAQVVDTTTGAVVNTAPSVQAAQQIAAQYNGSASPGFVSLNTNQIPDPNQINNMMVPGGNIGQNADVFDDDMYDTQLIATGAAAQQVNFFAAANADRSFASNFAAGGQLPNHEQMYVKYLGIEYWNDNSTITGLVCMSAVEILDLFRNLSYTISVANKVYAQGDGYRFLSRQAALTTNTNPLTFCPFRTLTLRVPIIIPGQTQVSASIYIKALGTALSGTNNYLKIRLSGEHYRDVQ